MVLAELFYVLIEVMKVFVSYCEMLKFPNLE